MKNYEILAKTLGTSADKLMDLDAKMSAISGKTGAMDAVIDQNQEVVEHVLGDLGLNTQTSAQEVYDALSAKLLIIDQQLYNFLDKPDLAKLSQDPGKLASAALQVFTPPKGFFIKKEKVVELLSKQPPQSLLDHFGYTSIQELMDKEGFASVVAAFRFTQTTEWMHQFFDVAYQGLSAADFEARDVEIKVLDTKWLDIAQKFIGKKLHNVSHLKEYGVIFISPEDISTPGETLRTFTLLLHYLHEVPFYSGLFKQFISGPDFISKFQSLLRGDVPEGPGPTTGRVSWRIVQRFLAKDDPADFRLHEHHVNPEAEHWFRVEADFKKLATMLGSTDKFNISYWTGLDHIGEFFPDPTTGTERLISFGIIDLIMSAVKHGEVKYLYHQQEAMWNRIFSSYMTRERMNALIETNIIKGFIEL